MNGDICQRLGANIRSHRIASGWTLNDLSKLLGVSYQQIQKYEKGANRMPIDMAVRVAGLFKCSLDELCGLRIPDYNAATGALVRRVSSIRSPVVQHKLLTMIDLLEEPEYPDLR